MFAEPCDVLHTDNLLTLGAEELILDLCVVRAPLCSLGVRVVLVERELLGAVEHLVAGVAHVDKVHGATIKQIKRKLTRALSLALAPGSVNLIRVWGFQRLSTTPESCVSGPLGRVLAARQVLSVD